MAAASLCLAAVACSKDDIALESSLSSTSPAAATKARRKPVPPRTNGKRETWFILGFRELSKIQPPIPAVNGKLR